MYIKHLTGPRKGEVEEFPFDVAKRKIDEGEAEAATFGAAQPKLAGLDMAERVEVTLPEVVSTRVDAITTSAGKLGLKKRK